MRLFSLMALAVLTATAHAGFEKCEHADKAWVFNPQTKHSGDRPMTYTQASTLRSEGKEVSWAHKNKHLIGTWQDPSGEVQVSFSNDPTVMEKAPAASLKVKFCAYASGFVSWNDEGEKKGPYAYVLVVDHYGNGRLIYWINDGEALFDNAESLIVSVVTPDPHHKGDLLYIGGDFVHEAMWALKRVK